MVFTISKRTNIQRVEYQEFIKGKYLEEDQKKTPHKKQRTPNVRISKRIMKDEEHTLEEWYEDKKAHREWPKDERR